MAEIIQSGRLPALPRLPALDFLGIGGGDFGGGFSPIGGGSGGSGGGSVPIPVTVYPGVTVNAPVSQKTVESLGQSLSLISCIFAPTSSCLLRILFLILGLICVVGAIYLYKPTNEMLVQPAIKAGRAAAAAATG